MSEIHGTGLRLLSFDGGGFRGLSALYILREIIYRIRRDEGRDDIEPWQCFDMIVGTSMGGLIALMLGRLRMPINMAIKHYNALTEKVLSETKFSWQDGIFKATLLEEATRNIVQQYSETRDGEAYLLDTRPDSCKVFVCAMSAANMRASIPTHFRTFTTYGNDASTYKIWEAVRATSADSIFFKQIETQDIGLQDELEYIDGGIGYNNPTDRVLKEADRVFRGAHVACLVSIGMGKGDAVRLWEPGLKENTVPRRTLDVLEQIATDCESTHDQISRRFERFERPGLYFRFSLDRTGVGVMQRRGSDGIVQNTEAYLRFSIISHRVDQAASALRIREPIILLSDAARGSPFLLVTMSNNLGSPQDDMDSRGLRLLSLDGGRIRGLSSLLILKEIMNRVKRDEGLDEVPRPCDYFDVIGGTGMGGLIAIMLGRLRMSVSDAMEAYVRLSDQIFSEHKHRWQEGKFKASLLEKAIKEIVADNSSSEGEDTRMFDPLLQDSAGSKGCRAFVCASLHNGLEGMLLVHFRTYDSTWNPMPNCKIWEAARATTAAPTLFKSISINDENGDPLTFVDGGLLANNPTAHVLLEAKGIFPDRPVSCIISIGAGHFTTFMPTGKTNAVSNAIVPSLKLALVVNKIATDCEKVDDELAGRFIKYPGVYFRFNVDHGALDIGLGEFEKFSELAAHTNAYFGLHENDTRANSAAASLKSTRTWGTVSIDDIAY